MVEQARELGVWFVAIEAGTGSDIYTKRMVDALNKRGIKSEVTWLPLRAEYAPWTVKIPTPPAWANVVHINSWLHSRFIPRNLPVVVTFHFCVHDDLFHPYKSFIQALYHKFWIYPLEKKNFCRATALTAVSSYTAKVVEQVFRGREVKVIHNWIDSKVFCPADHQSKPSLPYKLLFVGKPSLRKGVDLLVPIMEKLGDDYELSITCGSDVFEKSMRIPRNIKCIGWKDSEEAIVRLYQASDVLLFPSRMEGFGYVALEAQACGLPVVCANSSSLTEVVKNGVTGKLCEKDNVNEFVESIREVVHVLQNDNSLRKNCRIWANEKFCEEELVKRYVSLYQKLLC